MYCSYDTWVPSTDIEDEPQPEPQHQGPWQVTQKCTVQKICFTVSYPDNQGCIVCKHQEPFIVRSKQTQSIL